MGKSFRLAIEPDHKKIFWQPHNGINIINNRNPLITVTEDRQYKLVLQDSLNCFSDTTWIRVRAFPLPQVNVGDNKIMPLGSTLELQAETTGNIASYEWTPSRLVSCSYCPSTTALLQQEMTYDLTVKTDSGCMASDQLLVSVLCDNANIEMPTAFTPNQDGLNDLFSVHAKGIRSIQHFTIFDRSGNIMYQASNFTPNRQTGWNGRSKGLDQPSGTYVYVIEAICDAGFKTTKKGSFILLR
jgi:gliding motility-associated-like protein